MCVKPLCWIIVFCFTSFSTSQYTLEAGGVPSINMWDFLSGHAVAYLLAFLASAALLLYVSVVAVIIISLVASKVYLHKSSCTAEPGDVMPGVSIVKPLMGVDPLLEYNLETHFTLTYPKFELLFCFHDDQDPAISLVQKLHKKYPHVNIKMFIGGKPGVINPMVQNMAPAYEAASYEFVWISSSRVEISDEIIFDMASKLQQPSVSLVHQIPFTSGCHGFGSTVEKVYFGGTMSRFYMSFNLVGLLCVTGMSYMFKKSLLDEANGLAWYGKYLAEDYFLTTALHERGRMVMSAFPARQNVAQITLSAFIERMVRWVRLRLNMMVAVVILEPIIDCFPLGLITAWALYFWFCVNPYYFFLAHVLCWIVVDYLQLCHVQNGPPPFSKCQYVIAWLVRELSATYIQLYAFSSPQSISWGQRKFKVRYGGLVEEVSEKKLNHL